MKLIKCDCGHCSHPVKGKPKSFKFEDKYMKYYSCPGCRSIIALQSSDQISWKRVKLTKTIVHGNNKIMLNNIGE